MKLLLYAPYLKTLGGAEKLQLEYLKRTKFDVDLYTQAYIPEKTFDGFREFNPIPILKSKFINNIAETFFSRGVIFTATGLLGKIDTRRYDAMLVSSSGIGMEIAIRNHIPGATFMYCHSPLRAAADWYDIQWVKERRMKGIRKFAYPIMRRGYNIIEKLSWNKYDHTFFNSELTKERALNKKIVKEENASVIYPGIDIPRRGGRDMENFLVYISRFTDMKRQLELLKAWSLFYNKYHPDLELVLVSGLTKKDYYYKVKELANKTPGARIVETSSYDTVQELYSKAMAGIFLGYYEDFGIVPFEVLAHNKPLIAVDSGGFMELAYNAPSIITIPERFNEDMFVRFVAMGLEKFWVNREEYIKKAKRNRKFVKDLDLTWDRFARELDKGIEERIK